MAHMLSRSIFVLGLALLVACGSGESDAPSQAGGSGDYSPVLARVGDVEITRAYFDYRHENLSPGDKMRFSGDDWENRFIDALLEEIVISEQAEAENFDRIREVEYRLDAARRSVLFKAYYDRKFQSEFEIPEDEIVTYNESKPEEFVSLGRALARHIQCASEEKIREGSARLAEGAVWEEMVTRYSEDEETRKDGGQLGWFNDGGYVLGMGFNEEFTSMAFSMEPNSISKPFKAGDNWHIIKLIQRSENKQQPLDEVRDRIERRLRPNLAREAFEGHVRQLKSDMDLTFFGSFAEREQRTAEELYRLAGETTNAHAKIDYYRQLVEMYPDHERADDALFMQGFISSEEFAEVGRAAVAFRKVIRNYPDSEYVESARYMLKNLGRANPSLRGQTSPRGAEEVRGRIDEIKE